MKILLAVDSSAESDLAVKAVAARPWPRGTTVEVLSVVEPLFVSEVTKLYETLKQRAGEIVLAAAQHLQSSGIECTTRVLCGNVKGSIVEYAGASGSDFIVVGSHELTTMRQFLRGSVTRAVVRFAPCSVEVIRGVTGPGAMKILLATDGSPYAEAAARSVAERPWPAGTQIRVLSVADQHTRLAAMADPSYFDKQLMEKLQQDAMKRAQQAVAIAEKIISDGHLTLSGTVSAPSTTPKEGILKEADDWGAHLIVVASHGHGGLTRLLLGSVSEAVATCARCSVEVIRRSRG